MANTVDDINRQIQKLLEERERVEKHAASANSPATHSQSRASKSAPKKHIKQGSSQAHGQHKSGELA